ncbi:MAG: peptidyl-prolyl cis-trans isomerase [Alphaproteobacteria bacterium]|nr:MAG: peptidyl-prolyl cis-trans isomerase [Alphaproteobacteria bacterium]
MNWDTITHKGLLACAAGLGLVLVLADLTIADPTAPTQPTAQTAALVNGAPISNQQLARVVSGYESDTRRPATQDDRAHILERLIEEELLVQRGIEVNMAEHDPAVRAALVQSMISLVTTETGAIEPEESDIRDYYERNKALFVAAPQLHLRAYWGAQRDRDPTLPDTLIPATKLVDYLGPEAFKIAMKLDAGDQSLPIETPQGPLVLELIEKTGGAIPPYESIKDQVRVAYLVERDERALRDEIERLKKKATIERYPSQN